MIDIDESVRYEDSTHTYWLDGVRVPSITQSLEPACFDDFDFVTPQALARAAEMGTTLHRMIEIHLKHSRSPIDFAESDEEMDRMIDLLPDLDAFFEFQAKTGFVTEKSEQIVASRRYRFAGRIDLYGHFPEGSWGPRRNAICEIKRTATAPRSAELQTAGQEIAIRETFDIPDSVQIERNTLHLRHGRFNLIPHKNKKDRIVFLSALSVKHWRMK